MAYTKRIEAVDILRGATMAFMVIVNNPGDWGNVYAPLRHAAWNGMTPTDCIFPVFLFLMGFSMYISLSKSSFRLSGKLLLKIIKRTLLLFGIGMGIGICMKMSFDGVRILGVLQRFALCYFFVALTACTMNHKALPWLALILLAGYTVLLLLGNGFEYGPGNVLSKVDVRVLGEKHMYIDNMIEPEGILSTIPAIAHTLIGFCIGRLCMSDHNTLKQSRSLFIAGSLMMLAGLVLQYGCPLNKKVWSPTFVLVTCGLGSMLLGILIWAIDERKFLRHTQFWKVFGTNSILCYILADALAWLCANIPVAGTSLGGFIMRGLNAVFGVGCFASLMFPVILAVIIWALVLPLYKNKVYVKL